MSLLPRMVKLDGIQSDSSLSSYHDHGVRVPFWEMRPSFSLSSQHPSSLFSLSAAFEAGFCACPRESFLLEDPLTPISKKKGWGREKTWGHFAMTAGHPFAARAKIKKDPSLLCTVWPPFRPDCTGKKSLFVYQVKAFLKLHYCFYGFGSGWWGQVSCVCVGVSV